MDVGGRAMQGAIAERQSEGFLTAYAKHTLTPTLSLREREPDRRLS
jgi:hypothetical protein